MKLLGWFRFVPLHLKSESFSFVSGQDFLRIISFVLGSFVSSVDHRTEVPGAGGRAVAANSPAIGTKSPPVNSNKVA